MNYNFNPELPEPLNRIHPLQLNRVRKFLDYKFPRCVRNIFIFGSSVDLTCHPKSDIDFYIIHEEMDESAREELRDGMYRHGRTLDAACDFIYATREDFDAYKDDAGTVEYDVIKDGVCIYAAK